MDSLRTEQQMQAPEENVFQLFKEQKEGLWRRNIMSKEGEGDDDTEKVPETR